VPRSGSRPNKRAPPLVGGSQCSCRGLRGGRRD
jgi:hypothetical protein